MLGTTLLHYTITEKLGEGGMGVVYKARDTHLDRFVALKILPPDRVSNDERKRRFIQEAKAASALNHPNIVTIYDIASDRDTTFIAMEFVSGQTLADVIPRQGLPLSQVLKYAVQVADGLARAHDAGIVHRDLKPGNIMIGSDGRVRIVDFGLAKLAEPTVGADDVTVDNDTRHDTDKGIVVGTVAYMSPEQAGGDKVDTRSDIFSFGVVLYEMVTGHPPFAAQSRLATLSAILKDSPNPLFEIAPSIPPEFERLVDRCLRKDPDRRWQHMQDIRVALLDLKEESDSGRLAAVSQDAVARSSKRWRYAAVGAAVVVIAAAAGAWWLAERSSTLQETGQNLQVVPLTSYEGDERDPSFSPDGNQISFTWGPEGGIGNTYLKLIGPGDPFRLTNTPDDERMSQWSPDGKWILYTAARPGGTVIVAKPPLGGPERMLAQLLVIGRATWSPDSKWAVVANGNPRNLYLAPLQGGEAKLLLPAPKDGVLGPGSISPDGRLLAFTKSGALHVVSLGNGYVVNGVPRRLTESWRIQSWAWTPDSRDIVFIQSLGDANLGADSFMYRVAAEGGAPRRMEFAGDNAWYLDVSRQGNRLAFTRLRRDLNLYEAELKADGTLASPGKQVATSSRREVQGVYSPDGSRIAFVSNRVGSEEIWISDRDGKNAVQLTTSVNPDLTGSPRWSPDGERIVYLARAKGADAVDVFVVPVRGGTPVQITEDPGAETNPAWSRDGKWIYFGANRGGVVGTWKVAATGGKGVNVVRLSAYTWESPDGQWLYGESGLAARSTILRQGIGRSPVAGGDSEILVRETILNYATELTARGLYYLSPAEDLKSATLKLLPLNGGPPKTLGTIQGAVRGGLSVSPDFKSILYSQCDQCAADIMLVENFK